MPATKKPDVTTLQALWYDVFSDPANLATLIRLYTTQDDQARALVKELAALSVTDALLVVLNRLQDDPRKGVGSMATAGFVYHTNEVSKIKQTGKER